MNKGVIIFGSMGAGKDTVADMMLDNCETSKKYNIGDTVRNIGVITEQVDEWKVDNSILIKFLKEKAIEFKENVDIFCKTFNVDDIVINVNYITEKMSTLFLDFDLWKDGTRPLLQSLADVLREADKNSMNYFVIGKTLKDRNSISLPIIVGGRTPADFEFYKSYGFKALGIKCDIDIRKERLIQRDGVSQLSHSTHNTEMYVEELVNKADIIIDNNGTLENLENQINALIQSLK